MSQGNSGFLAKLPIISIIFLISIMISVLIHIYDALVEEDFGTEARYVDYLVAILLLINIGWFVYHNLDKKNEDLE